MPDLAIVRRELIRCSRCGRMTPESSAASTGRRPVCPPCQEVHLHVRAQTALVSSFTRYEDDVAARLFVAHFTDGATLEQVGDAFGITRERVRQLEAKALDRARKRAEREFNGETLSLTDWAERFGVSGSAIRARLASGKNPDGSPSGSASKPPPSRRPRKKLSDVVADEARSAAQAVAPLALLERLGIAHELVATTPKGHVVLFPIEAT